ncbi:hypothetical protein IU433_13525 [Nocardia puris]|uniref:Uncharacterized protein n=1 Tax=Nocardia puris TaxID=208602 RepID=A0A366DMX6_9NOCA|nr:hypothetical protein [Nocardia puris]MBF6213478.1 hypothetical protein [Nocardia puris]MBF6365592.1 hypothetical protein [Nocardia puris]MBF6460058.1 hypothetical protein [Nocardia puris]RBO91457.1 hypothetical protein DFR74_104159 [Nocardia puris]
MRKHGFGRPGGWQQADLPDPADVPDWFAGRLPQDWFTGEPVIEVDREEIVVIGELPMPEPKRAEEGDEAPTEKIPTATKEGAISRFRESTRPDRMKIASEAQRRYGRNVAWGVSVDGERIMFTQLAVPVMTRLRQPERKVLDTLVDSGVARSRSDALAWTVKLAGKHAEEWLEELRTAMRKVDDLRSEGPKGL